MSDRATDGGSGSGPDDAVGFRETQRFRQRWVWALLAGAFLVSLIFVPFSIPGVAVLALVAWFLYAARLTTEVRDDGVYVRFAPLHQSFRRVGFEEIERAEATTYRPLAEFGGWGIRWRPGAIAYNVSGDRGVRIVRDRGRTVVIGSRRPDELAAAIDAASRAE